MTMGDVIRLIGALGAASGSVAVALTAASGDLVPQVYLIVLTALSAGCGAFVATLRAPAEPPLH